jgi:hypothetical protein
VSRSKDALRKHISYRHPGTPSPCESENRRKRTKLASQIQQIQAQQMAANNLLFQSNQSAAGPSSNMPLNLDTSVNAANQLALLQSFTSEMTIPTQASIYQQHQQQQHQQQSHQHTAQQFNPQHQNIKNEINNNGDEQMAGDGGNQ